MWYVETITTPRESVESLTTMPSLFASKQPARLEKIKIRLASMARFQLAFMALPQTINYLMNPNNY